MMFYFLVFSLPQTFPSTSKKFYDPQAAISSKNIFLISTNIGLFHFA